jgi:YesN/AraC family two-component response regulator
MPVMDGIQMCEIIRNDNTTSHIPLIILTAHESFAIKLKSFNSGIDDYITKPFSPQLLQIKVNNLLSRRRELQKKFSRDITLEPTELAINNADEDFLKKAMNIVQENLTDEDFSADAFADKMAMSRVHLYRKLKSLTGESVSDFVRTIRLKLAAGLLKNKGLSVKETAYSVGFNDPKYFSKCFKQQFGVKPTDYARNKTTSEQE